MKSFALIAQSLVLSLLLAGSALAAEKVNINTADAATIDRVLVNVGPSKAEAIVAAHVAARPDIMAIPAAERAAAHPNFS